MTTITKLDLTQTIIDSIGFNNREAKEIVEAFFKEIGDALEKGEEIKLSGFGNFKLRDKPQRPGRNPKTGQEIPITARRVVTFQPSAKLKDAVESKATEHLRKEAA